ncbi:hypothetical protein [Anaeromyxobacter paludicola]|uniref:Uncharacterized protein n=1 Tax=Anaeromyxobacter paludicola TaxID=2918171 RepID=A0ABM7XA70_9BACT|nr:hypothetical protein [Anaeromyxobacter paludicola]BDG08740.1 hypothetical protein AMPC_18530 [Anaeromyxobacter paludicola]
MTPKPEDRRARAAERVALVRARVAELEHQREVRRRRKRGLAGAAALLACAPLVLLATRDRTERPYVEIVSSGKVEIEYQGRTPAIQVHRGLLERRTVPHAEVRRRSP